MATDAWGIPHLGVEASLSRQDDARMRHPMAVLIGAILIWIAAIASLFNQPIVWWQSALLGAAALLITMVYVRERGNPSP